MKHVFALLLLFAVCGPAAAKAAEFKLEARPFDVVHVGPEGPEGKLFTGTIESMDENLVVFKEGTIRYRWPRSQVTVLERRCTLEEAYQQATEAAGNDPRARLRLYEACMEAKLKNEAIAELRKAIKADPTYLPAYSKLLDAARTSADLNMEMGTLDAAAAAGVATSEMRLRKAVLSLRLGLVRNAEEALQKLLAMDPLHAEAESKLALLELAAGKPDAAELRIRTVLRRDPKNIHALLALGQLELERSELDRSAKAFTEAVAAGDESPIGPSALGAIALRQGRRDEAGRHYAAALAVSPGYAPALAGLGLIAALNGDLPRAAELLGKAVESAPKRPDILLAQAYASERAGQHAATLKAYEGVLALDPANVNALVGAGRCHWRLGNRDKAQEFFRKALWLEPDFVPALRGMGHALIASDPAGAVEFLAKIARSGRGTADDRARLAGAFLRLNRFEEARAELAQAGASNAHARAMLGFLAYAQGRSEEAIAHFEAAVKLGDPAGYAAGAIQRIRQAERQLTWEDRFQRDEPESPVVLNGWTEMEPPGVAFSIAGNMLLVDGTPTGASRLARLARSEGEGFVSIAAELETGAETESFVGVFVAKQGGPPVLFGRSGGVAALLVPGQSAPREFTRRIRPGRFTVQIEFVGRGAGAIRLRVDDQQVGGGEITVPELGGAKDYEVGVFALAPEGKGVNCRFHSVKIVRTK